MTPRIVDKPAKRKLIIEAALKVFAKSGLYDFKMIEVAEAAGVGKGTLYEYFPSKNALIAGSFALFMEEFESYIVSQLGGTDDPAGKIERLISSSMEFCLAEKERLDALFDFYAAGIPKHGGKSILGDLAPNYRQMIGWVAEIVADGIKQGVFRPVDDKLVASMILALLDGLFFQAALGVTQLDGKKTAQGVSRILLDGLSAPGQVQRLENGGSDE